MSDGLLPYRVDQLEKELARLTKELEDIDARNQARDEARVALERKQLVWGISVLGAAVMTLAGVIWSYRAVIFKGAL